MDELKAEKMLFRGSLGLVGLWLAASIFLQNRLPPEMPLFYSRPWGEEQLVPQTYISFVLLGLALSWGVNFFLAKRSLKTDKFLGRMFVWSGILIILLGLSTVTRIWMLFI